MEKKKLADLQAHRQRSDIINLLKESRLLFTEIKIER
jgi:hypothetical protein